MIKEYFVLAMRNLNKRKLRSLLTMLGIFISIATIFMLISLSLGLQGAVQEQFRMLGTDKIFIQPSTSYLGPPGSVGGVILTDKDVEVASKVRGVKDYSYFTAGNAKVEFSGETRFRQIWGISGDHLDVYEEINSFKAEDGRFIDGKDVNEVIVGWLYPQGKIFGKEVRTGNKLTINDEDFKVKGTIARIGNPDDDGSIFIDIKPFRKLFSIPDRVDIIILQIDEGEDINEVSDRVEKELRQSRGVTEKTQDFEIVKPEELLESFGNILNIITVFLAGIAAISLIVGGIGIANTMYTSVLERTKEIGIMKAIGAKNRDILSIFLIESGLLGLVGGGIGVLIGMGASKLIEYIAVTQLDTTLLQISSPPYLILGCLAFGFLIGAISGTLPAIQASRTNVVDALRHE